ncbi:hypothetical protein A2U01_0103883, partial [Trifolium medium]|nr:hypothetical protein [Trifolium medium]
DVGKRRDRLYEIRTGSGGAHDMVEGIDSFGFVSFQGKGTGFRRDRRLQVILIFTQGIIKP